MVLCLHDISGYQQNQSMVPYPLRKDPVDMHALLLSIYLSKYLPTTPMFSV